MDPATDERIPGAKPIEKQPASILLLSQQACVAIGHDGWGNSFDSQIACLKASEGHRTPSIIYGRISHRRCKVLLSTRLTSHLQAFRQNKVTAVSRRADSL